MQIKARRNKNIIILDLFGSIDENSANLIEVVGQCVRDGYNDILCNFEYVEFIDYMGVSVLVIAYKEVINNKGRMKFVNLPVHLKGIFSISGLDKVIEIYAEENLAVNSFRDDKIIEKIEKMQLRRRFKRLPIDIKINLKAKYNKTPFLKADILNLSGVGAYIFGCGEFKLGDIVVLKVKLPAHHREIEIEAKVVWLPDKQIQHQLYPGMGVEFQHIPTTLQQKIIEFIERNLSSLTAE